MWRIIGVIGWVVATAACSPGHDADEDGATISSDGRTLYVAALGSSKLGVFSTRALETDSFVPSTADQIVLSGGGPGAPVLDSDNDRPSRNS